MKAIKHTAEVLILAIIVAGFVYVGARRLGTVPMPDTDEAMTLQVPYEMLYRGKLAFPMYQFLGGNIENSWHSYTPVFFVMLSGFLKAFGWGLTQGRAFNLIAAVLVLLMVHLIGRRLFDWRAGLIAVALLVSDPVFLARSRLVRNDYLGVAFALLAFYLYEKAEQRQGKWCYAASGLAAGAGVMCHTNVLYILCVLLVLMFLKHGWKLVKKTSPYLVGAGAFLVMAYEIVYDIIDYKNFLAQNRMDSVHFRVFEIGGWLNNIIEEPRRYVDWYDARGVKFAPQETLPHIFLILTVSAIAYLIVRAAVQIRRRTTMSDSRVRVLVTALIVMLFLALVTQRKVLLYVAHFAPWFALSVGIMLRDALAAIFGLRTRPRLWARLCYGSAVVAAGLMGAVYGFSLVRQADGYLKRISDPELATFDEIAGALRSIVPDGVCPASIGTGFLWLAFPEHDRCFFAYMESRIEAPLNLEGKDYALLVKPKFIGQQTKVTAAQADRYHLLGEVRATAYGTIRVYYTGSDPRHLSRNPKRYYFFGNTRGHVDDEQLANGQEVWRAGQSELSQCAEKSDLAGERESPSTRPQTQSSHGDRLISLCTVELEASTIYQVNVEARPGGKWQLLILDDASGAPLDRAEIGEQEEQRHLEELFKTASRTRVRFAILVDVDEPTGQLPLSQVSIRRIAQL